MDLNILEMGKDDLLGLKIGDMEGFLKSDEAVHIAKTLGAFWQYDYEAAEKGKIGMHALLKSGLHSDGFFVSRILLAQENIRRIISSQMAKKIDQVLPELDGTDYIAGVPDGATKIGEDIAEMLGTSKAIMEKVDGKIRLITPIEPNRWILLIEDFCTRGTGFKEAVEAVRQVQSKIRFYAYEPVILNRGGLKYVWLKPSSFEVLSLVDYAIKDWDPAVGCPLCDNGSPVIKPKETDANWQTLIHSQE